MPTSNSIELNKCLISSVEDYIACRPKFSIKSPCIINIQHNGNEHFLYFENSDKSSPHLFRVKESGQGNKETILPYFSIKRRKIPQLISFFLGRESCNLSEISEFFGALYSRFAGSYEIYELKHVDVLLSKMALWIHDCLTEDFDHNVSLNRYNHIDGACISYDFGMAFSNYYFPPFYIRELGLSDTSIENNSAFVINQLEKYLQMAIDIEDKIIFQIKERYPATAKADVCRYYLRNFRAYFPVRLYYGRFFEKFKAIPFDNEFIAILGEALKINITGIHTWESLIEKLFTIRHPSLNLKHLDLSNVDFGRADLRGADLKGANLSNADLRGADLKAADLTGADLRGADLKGADLRDAILSGADLKNAKLEGVL